MTPPIDHVALLVRDIEVVVARVAAMGLSPGEIETFAEEGTRECYVGEAGRPGLLLLMQPLSDDGPYGRALVKRGPGLHHVAFHHGDLDDFLAHQGRGWLLHPASLTTHAASRTVWLARPGISTLIEVHGATPAYAGEPVVAGVRVRAHPSHANRLGGLGLERADEASLHLGGAWRPVEPLVT